VTGNQAKATQPDQIQINNIDGVKAPVTTTQEDFTDEIGIRERKFRRINDLDKDEKIEEGQYYYTKAKKSKAEVAHHITQPGETLWSISQMYGIKLSSLKAKNRIHNDQDLKAGMVLKLRDHRKRGEEIRIVPVNNTSPAQVNITPTSTSPVSQVRRETVPSTQPPGGNNQNQGSERIVHTVAQGENLFRISQRYNVSVDNLKLWNSLPDNNIKIGQKIILFKQ
jgi:membrane-bound lytic murein transglycosylase D